MRARQTIIIASTIALACGPQRSERIEPLYPFQPPPHFPALSFLENNPPTVEGFELGRRLFYDPALSLNGQVSCASCHTQAKGFADGLRLTHVGVSGATLERHAPALFNVGWSKRLFWDGGVTSLEAQALAPIIHPDEMASHDLVALEETIRHRKDYAERFDAAFAEDVSISGVRKALALFQRAMISGTSAYDRFLQGETSALSEPQARGLNVYERECSPCHKGVLLTDDDFHDNGLDDSYPAHPQLLFEGRARITGDAADLGKYKTPTLRNIAVSAPYMHDGRLASLSEVLHHYRFGMKDSPNLDSRFRKTDGALGVHLTDLETQELLEFLDALTDPEALERPELGPPSP